MLVIAKSEKCELVTGVQTGRTQFPYWILRVYSEGLFLPCSKHS